VRRAGGAGRAALVALLGTALVLAAPLLAQSRGETAPIPPASPLLPADHWAVQAVWRAQALGLVPGFEAAQRLMPREEVRRALRSAAEHASEPGLRASTQAWLDRFDEEYPAGHGESPPPTANLSAAYVRETGRVGPGVGEFPPTVTGALPLPDRNGVIAAAELSASLSRHFAVLAAPALVFGDARIERAELVVALGPWQLSVGRGAVGYGWGRSGGVILSGTSALDRAELSTSTPVRLPGFLATLGPAAFDLFLTRLPGDRHPGRPYLWGARVVIQPHPRLSLAVERATMFGGVAGPITGSNLLKMLSGIGDSGFENQEAAVAARYRLPTEALLPLTAYAEAGTEDGAGAWRDVPGYVVGLYAPRLPLLPAVDLGAELASFSRSCCSNPPWYRHSAFPGNWATAERPLGHPLGGAGHEMSIYSSADLVGSRLRVRGRVYERRREQDNLFVPGREGRSRGGEGEVSWRWGPQGEITGAGAREVGSGWAESRAEVGIRIFAGVLE
jgi:hypothetical protein